MSERLRKRTTQRAQQFLKDMKNEHERIRLQAKNEGTGTRYISFFLAAGNQLENYNLPRDAGTTHKVAHWIQDANANLAEVEALIARYSIPVLFAEHKISIQAGKVLSPNQEEIQRLADFIRPYHIYLDVTFATWNDLKAIWGRRKNVSEVRREVKAETPFDEKVKSRAETVKLFQDQGEPLQRFFSFDLPSPRNGQAYTLQEIEGFCSRNLKREIAKNPKSLWKPRLSDCPLVCELQDYRETLLGTLIRGEKIEAGRKGRTKGDFRKRKPWFNGMSVDQVREYLRVHPREITRKENDYMKQEKANALEKNPNLSDREIRTIRAKAKRRYYKNVRLPLKREEIP